MRDGVMMVLRQRHSGVMVLGVRCPAGAGTAHRGSCAVSRLAARVASRKNGRERVDPRENNSPKLAAPGAGIWLRGTRACFPTAAWAARCGRQAVCVKFAAGLGVRAGGGGADRGCRGGGRGVGRGGGPDSQRTCALHTG